MSKELVFCFLNDGCDGVVLFASGQFTPEDLSYQGQYLEDWDLEPKPAEGIAGLMIWEGSCVNASEAGFIDDWEPEYRGNWRRPTAKEMWMLRNPKDACTIEPHQYQPITMRNGDKACHSCWAPESHPVHNTQVTRE